MIFRTELAAWSKLARDQFQVLLLTLLYMSILAAILHMGHDQADTDNIEFARQGATGVGGCLFGFLKGREQKSETSTTVTTTNPPTTTTIDNQ